jgi:DNA polymerase-4
LTASIFQCKLISVTRKIIHLDLDAFFCSVEERQDPSLRGKPFIVGGNPGQRGVVASASYPARTYGIHSAMPTSQAVRLCPGLLIVHGRHGAYGEASREVMERLAALTPLVEQISIDEAFMDVSDLPEPGLEIAGKLQARIHSELDLPCSLGVATNKLVAKMATDAGKATLGKKGEPPNAILVVPPGEESAFFAPLPVQALWGVGPKTAERLNGLGVHKVGEILNLPAAVLEAQFGKSGLDLMDRARGIDDRPVETSRDVKSVSQETTFDKDTADGDELVGTLRHLAEQVGYRLRKDHLAGSTVRLKLRWPDFSTITRQVTLPQPADQDGVILAAACALFDSVWQPERAVRLLGVGVSGLTADLRQLSLWDTPPEKERRLLEAVDALRSRYGDQIILRASKLPRKP